MKFSIENLHGARYNRTMNNKPQADFCIEIDFKKGTEAPNRVFRALSDLIDAFHSFDLHLISSIDSKIEPVILLEDIETGSIKTWLRYVLNVVDDEAIKKLDWKPAIGKYLVKAKYLLIDFTKEKTEITDKNQITQLQDDILKLAKETDVKNIPDYQPVSGEKLLQNIKTITQSASILNPEDKLIYRTGEDATSFNLSFRYAPETVEALLTRESIESQQMMILKVRKPDYLGDSRWDFRHGDRSLPAKITDTLWLQGFQNREEDVRPGDSIKAEVKITTKYGDDLDVISVGYEILKVLEVIKYTPLEQGKLL
ncbi:MAG: hypothetical protein HY890_01675 [Deltaproteobacteria bacterium]|nr:hypothetical protein [Deltaproteobacteria bacterium]